MLKAMWKSFWSLAMADLLHQAKARFVDRRLVFAV